MLQQTHRLLWLFFLVFLAGCTAIAVHKFDQDYGPEQTQQRMVELETPDGEYYFHNVKPILDNRCVVCHGCYDAPCQLKLSSPEGIDRGLSKDLVYASRLVDAEPSRLFEDYQTTQQWREKGFVPVLNERSQSAQVNLEAGLVYRMLQLKQKNPLGDEKILTGDYDFSLSRSQYCPSIEEYGDFSKQHPSWGMPYGLQGLSDEEFGTMEHWLANGAKMAALKPLTDAEQKMINIWEKFLNQDSNKHQLMSRYVYEHLFLQHLYFNDEPHGRFFTIVRSKTPPGEKVDRISTRRPYDEPGVKRVYYRLISEKATILDKTHIPYRMDEARISRWKALFIEPNFNVAQLPGYAKDTTGNPFITFRDIPPNIRSEFLLDDAQLFIMGFIKGSVCRGEVALNSIEDRFWVYFVTPSELNDKKVSDFLAKQSNNLRMPGESKSALSAFTWREYAKMQKHYFDAKSEIIEKLALEDRISLNSIWDGNGKNENAALTVLRHFDNATVVKGLVGKPPKTAWVIDYPLFERIHYLLVAGFDPFGNIGHQFMTRLYMDFLRMEGEFNFVAFLPAEERYKEMGYWYRGADDIIQRYIKEMPERAAAPTSVVYKTTDYKKELFQQLDKRLEPVLSDQYELGLQGISDEDKSALQQLADLKGKHIALLPDVVFIRMTDEKGKEFFYSLIHNRGYANVTSLLDESKNRLPDEDTLTIVPGFIGAYPNVFWDITSADVDALRGQIASMETEPDYEKLLDNYGVRRTSKQFWALSDRFHEAYKAMSPLEAGLFDYNRLENR